ncbi:MAG: serine hydrolase [Eubacteriales bacterium]
MIIALFGILAVAILTSSVILGSKYNADSVAEDNLTPAEIDSEAPWAEHIPESEIPVLSENDTEAAMYSETESETETETESETEPETTPESDSDISPEETEPDNRSSEEKLYDLLNSEAPLKWARVIKRDDSGAVYASDEFVKVYPELSFAYYDIDSGEGITYNSAEIRYSASLIKAPYIYAVLREIEEFEKNKHDFDKDGNPLYDENGEPLFEGNHPNYDEDGKIIYLEGEEKYDLSEKWVYDSATMFTEGSGEIMEMDDGLELTWYELFDYALLYSDNIAFAQLRDRFGYSSFYKMTNELGIRGARTDFMNLSADDCVLFLRELYDYFETGSEYALRMKDCMTKSKHLEMICANYPSGMVAHKYGWDIDAFHDMAIVFDEHPYIIVIMTDYDDGGEEPTDFIGDVTELVKEIHAGMYPEKE